MASRRPRIKPTANLSVKRALKVEPVPELHTVIIKKEKDENAESNVKKEKIEPPQDDREFVPNYAHVQSPAPVYSPGLPSQSPASYQSPIPSRSPALVEPHFVRPFRLSERGDATPELDDSIFKSPLSSPSYPAFRNVNLSDKVTPQELSFDDSKGPPSPLKARPKFKPTPVFAQRRNSVQTPEEEEPRRQRHSSISSNYSVPSFPLPNTVGRVRTESTSSSFSDRSVFKPRRPVRSEDHQRLAEAKKELQQKYSGNPPDKNKLRIYDMIYYNPKSNPMKCPASKESLNEARERRLSLCSNTSYIKSEIKVEENTPALPEKNDAMPVPQLKLGPNGEMVLDEKSLYIETTGEKAAKDALAKANIVYDDEFNSNCGFYKRKKRTKDWPSEETIKFYRCLQAIGTDFSLMLQLFPNRTRRDLKIKFKKEERTNGALINKALIYHNSSFDIEELRVQFQQEEEKEQNKRENAEKIKSERKITREEVFSKLRRGRPEKRLSRAEKALTDGEFVNENDDLGDLRRCTPKRLTPVLVQSPAKRMTPLRSCSRPSTPAASPIKTPVYAPPLNITQIKTETVERIYTESEVLQMETVFEPNETAESQNITIDPTQPHESYCFITVPGAIEQPVSSQQQKPIEFDPLQIKYEKRHASSDEEDVMEKEQQQQGEEEEEGNGEDDATSLLEGIDINSLVVLETQDPEDETKTLHHVHTIDKETSKLSDDCLDLPDHIVELIVKTLLG